jgi:hypothetical protein
VKTAVMVLGFIAVGIALADMATGNTNHPLLPDVVGDHLEQQDDLIIGAVGAGALWLAFTQL